MKKDNNIKNNWHKSNPNELFENKLELLKESTQKYNLIYNWIKNDKITYKQFLKCIEKIEFLKENDIFLDD